MGDSEADLEELLEEDMVDLEDLEEAIMVVDYFLEVLQGTATLVALGVSEGIMVEEPVLEG